MTSVDRLSFDFSIWRFSEQFFFVNNHLECYWPTIHNLIQKICLKFQVLGSHFFKVNEQWTKLCKVKIFQFQSMSNAIRFINQRFAFNHSILRAWPWCSTCALLDRQSCTQKSSCRLCNTSSNMTSQISFFSADWHEPMAECLRLVTESLLSLLNWVRLLQECRNFLLPLCHFACHWVCQCTGTRAFILLRSL